MIFSNFSVNQLAKLLTIFPKRLHLRKSAEYTMEADLLLAT